MGDWATQLEDSGHTEDIDILFEARLSHSRHALWNNGLHAECDTASPPIYLNPLDGDIPDQHLRRTAMTSMKLLAPTICAFGAGALH